MAKRKPSTQKVPGLEPTLYSEAREETTDAFNHSDKPVQDGSTEDAFSNDGWVAFCLPQSNRVVHLKLRMDRWKEKDQDGKTIFNISNASPRDALREWFLVQEVKKLDAPRLFDVNRLLPFWNYGSGRRLSREACGSFHLGGLRQVSGYPVQAYRLWSACRRRGPNPMAVHAILDPDDRLPFTRPSTKESVPSQNRWVHVGIDLYGPLEEQLKDIKTHCRKLQDAALALAGLKRQRPGKREARRDTLMYTMHYSAGLTVPEIARHFYKKERAETAQERIRKVLDRVNAALAEAGIDPPRFKRGI